MQLFVTSVDPMLCARWLDNRRLNKQILEAAQVMAVALIEWGHITPIKVTHKNHPISVWVKQSINNYTWTYLFWQHCILEYSSRFDRVHKAYTWTPYFEEPIPDFEGVTLPKQFCNCTPHKDLPVLEAYKKTLEDKWFNDKVAARCSI